MQILAYYTGTIDLGIEFGLPQRQQPPPKAFAKTSTTDHTTPNCNKEYSGSAPGDIPNLQLHGYSNTAFTDSVNRKSTSSYIYKLAGGPVSHKSSKQLILTTSTTEAEYVAITHTAKEALWLRQLLTDLGYTGKDLLPIHLYGDNQLAINLAKSDDYHAHTKHFELY